MDAANLIKYFSALGIPCLLVLILTPLLIRLAPRVGLLDHPDDRRIHKTATPVGGGIAIFIAFHFGCFCFYYYFWPDYQGTLDRSWWLAFLLASSVLLIVGIIDDLRGMTAPIKLLGQIVACLIMYYMVSAEFYFFGAKTIDPFHLIFILPWYLVIINAFNLIDGMDGLCTGLALISSLGLAAVYILKISSPNAIICLTLAGACIGFLRYNYHPASIFLGDTGSMFLGFTLASISLYAGGKSSFFVTLATPIFIAGVPIIDTLLAIWRRSIRKVLANDVEPVKIMQADKDHLHHRLLAMGLTQHRVALTLYGINALIVICGLLYILAGDHAIGFFLIIFIASVYLLVKHVLQIELWETNRIFADHDLNNIPTRFTFIFHPVFDLLWMALAFTAANYIVLAGNLPFPSFGNWASQLLAWLMPTFILLILTHSYNVLWRNAFFKDYLFLTISIFTGSILSLALVSLLNTSFTFALLNTALLFCLFAFIGITGIRIIFHFIREWSMNANTSSSHNHPKQNVLLYGAGVRGSLYIRERYLQHSSELGLTNIIGFIDDDTTLRKQYLYGKIVFGGLNELTAIAQTHKVDQIVITTPLTNEAYRTLLTTAKALEINVIDWKTQVTQVI